MKLKDITKILISEEINFAILTEATQKLNQLYCEASEFDLDSEANRKDIHIEEGKAIGATWAARCVDEFLRTKMFVKGIYEAIQDLLEHQETVHILYAGSGPFATLVTPLTTLFSSQKLKFTILEINPISIKHLNILIKNMGLEAYVEDIIECNAAQVNLDKAEHFNIFLTETMLKALSKEPQVAITLNILPQLKKDVVLIPQNIAIEAGLKSWEKESQYMFSQGETENKGQIMLKAIFELNKSSVAAYISESNQLYHFPKVLVQLPNNIEKDYTQLFLGTRIRTYADNVLSGNDTSLTLPFNILDSIDHVNEVEFQYKIDRNPKFEYRIIS
jgi:predicted RNA methylase